MSAYNENEGMQNTMCTKYQRTRVVSKQRISNRSPIWTGMRTFIVLLILALTDRVSVATAAHHASRQSWPGLSEADVNPVMPEGTLYRMQPAVRRLLSSGRQVDDRLTSRNLINATPSLGEQGRAMTESSISSQGFMQVPLYGGVRHPAYYYTYVSIGTPTTQDFSVILDTGSDLLVVPCEGCNACGDHAFFDAELSESAEPETCTNAKTCSMWHTSCSSGVCSFDIHYSEGSSLSGSCYVDDLCLGHWDHCAEKHGGRVTTAFGCAGRMTNLFVSQLADGIVGVNDNKQGTIVDTLAAHHALKRDRFSICFGHTGGFLVAGGTNETLHQLDLIDYSNNNDVNIDGGQSSGQGDNENDATPNDRDNGGNSDHKDRTSRDTESVAVSGDHMDTPSRKLGSVNLYPTFWTKLERVNQFFGVTVENVAFTTATGLADMGSDSAIKRGVTKEQINEGRGFIVDSGSTYSYMPYDLFRSMRESLKEFCAGGPLRCGASMGFESNFQPKEGALASFTIKGRRKKTGDPPAGWNKGKCEGYWEDPSMYASFPVLKYLMAGVKPPPSYKSNAASAGVGLWSIEVLPQSYLYLHHTNEECAEATYIVAFFVRLQYHSLFRTSLSFSCLSSLFCRYLFSCLNPLLSSLPRMFLPPPL